MAQAEEIVNKPETETETEEKVIDSTNNNNNENSKLFDEELESTKLKQFIDLALNPASGSEWTVSKTKDPNLSIKYTQLPNDKLYTIRGQMDIKMNLDLFHSFTNGNYDDIFKWEKENDKMATDIHMVKAIDENHTIVYGSFNAGLGLWPRDFCWMKRRFLFENYKGPDGKEYRVGGDLCYSIDDTHPDFIAQKKGHVRGWLAMSGNVFVQRNDELCNASYIVNLDPAGWIPTWIANLVAPEQGLVIKHVSDNWYKIVDVMKKRNESENTENTENAGQQSTSTKDNVKGRAKGTFIE